MAFPRARPGGAATLDVADNSLETNIKAPDGIGSDGQLVWGAPWWVDTAPAAAEGLGGIFLLRGDWPHRPMEWAGTTRGSHLGAIGCGISTARQRWRANQPISSGQEFDTRIETLDTVASNGRAGWTAYYDNEPNTLRQVYSRFTRETQTNSLGTNTLADLVLAGADIILEGIGINVPSGVVTVDVEIAGRFIINSDSFEPVNEVSWDIDPFDAMDTGTSGILSQAQIWRQEMALLSTVPSVTVSSEFDLDVAMTTQTLESAVGFRFYKSKPSVNPNLR